MEEPRPAIILLVEDDLGDQILVKSSLTIHQLKISNWAIRNESVF